MSAPPVDAPATSLVGATNLVRATSVVGAEVSLARRFDQLHQLIYTRGGIRPSNSALEEVAKLVLIRLWSLRGGDANLFPGGAVADFQVAFAAALADPSLRAVDPGGATHPVWPPDEPFRLVDQPLLTAAASLVADIVDHGRPAVADPLGAAFDALLAGRYDHAGGLGTYLTPSGVARMMAEIAVSLLDSFGSHPRLTGPGFGDPYCGTGRFLVALLDVLRESGSAALLAAGAFGADQSTSAVAKARINLLLYGVEHPLIWTVRDSVTDSDVDSLRGTVPLILTNPPFGDRKYDDPAGQAVAAAAIPRLGGRSRLDPSLVGLVRAAELLAPAGVLGIILPDGVISSAAFTDLVLGTGSPLAAQLSLAACVSLPTATFALSGTVAKTSAVFVRRSPPAPQVTLARVQHVGYVRQNGRAAIDPQGDELPAVSHAVRASLRDPSGPPPELGDRAPLVVTADTDTLRTLNPAGLDPAALLARSRLADQGGVRLGQLLTPVVARRTRRVSSPFVSVLHIDDVGTIDWHAARDYEPSTPGLLARAGELIVSLLNPARLRAAVIPPEVSTVQVSAEFGVFRPGGDAYAALGLLYHPDVRAQLRPLGTGTSSSRRRIDVADILNLVVPDLGPPALAELGRGVAAASSQIAAARDDLWHRFAGEPNDLDRSADN